MASRKQLTVVFTAPQTDWLRREAERLDISIGELVRRIVDRWRDTGDRPDKESAA